MATEESTDSPLSEDAAAYLDEARKGKPRSFLLICKGADVVYMAVGKKTVKPAEATAAKKAGFKGDAYFGVITGASADLVFNLAQADGYKEPPVSDKKLREFIVEHAKLKVNPTIRIVAVQPPLPIEDATEQPPTGMTGGPIDEAVAVFNQLRPDVELALQHGVGDKTLLATLLAEARQRLDAQDGAGALERCRQLTTQLNDEWRRLAKTLLPRVQAVLSRPFTEQSGDVDKIRTIVGLAKERAESKRFGSATVSLVRMTPLLESAERGDGPKASDVITPGHVAAMKTRLEKARLRWDAGIQDALRELQKVQDGIQEVDADFAKAMPAVLRGYEQELKQLLVAAEKAENEQTRSATDAALALAEKLLDDVNADDFLAFMDAFQGDNVNLQDALAGALAEVQLHLRA